jgi:regulator of protease activity HflC (stomatin/prohibitin superfamily)
MLKKLIAITALALVSAGCTRIETGEVGLRKDFSGNVQNSPLGTGFHQSIIGDVLIFSSREVLVPLTGLKPITADKLPMEDVDIQFTYRVNEPSIAKLYIKYNQTYHVKDAHGDIIPMLGMVTQFVRSAASDAISKFPALSVNDRRTEIVNLITADVLGKIKAEGLDADVSVGQIVFTNVSIPKSIVTSTEGVVQAQNMAKAALQQVEIEKNKAQAAIAKAEGEAKAIQIQAQSISAQGGAAYLQLKAIEKWDGKMPVYLAPSAPLPFVGADSHK